MSPAELSIPLVEAEPVVPVITLSYDISINYAFQQNAIPVVKELRFKNDDTSRKNLVIRVGQDMLERCRTFTLPRPQNLPPCLSFSIC